MAPGYGLQAPGVQAPAGVSGTMARMSAPVTHHRARVVQLIAALFVMAAAVFAQGDMSGEWAIEFAAPQGPQQFTMYVVQEGPRLTGRLTSDAGEFPLRGTINGSEFTITWSFPDGNRLLEITFAGKFEGDSLAGTAKLGTRGSGPLTGTRTGQ
jgi:hypothetical protein